MKRSKEIGQYIAGIEYLNGSIDFIQTSEGIARKSGSSYIYEYNLADHLGNNRYTLNAPNGKLQAQDYYPFGMQIPKFVSGAKNNYLYNGDEWQDGANVYDAINRGYDPAIGRFWQMDAMAEKYAGISSFAFARNNPILYSDPSGLSDTLIMNNDPSNSLYSTYIVDSYRYSSYWYTSYDYDFTTDPFSGDRFFPYLKYYKDNSAGAISALQESQKENIAKKTSNVETHGFRFKDIKATLSLSAGLSANIDINHVGLGGGYKEFDILGIKDNDPRLLSMNLNGDKKKLRSYGYAQGFAEGGFEIESKITQDGRTVTSTSSNFGAAFRVLAQCL